MKQKSVLIVENKDHILGMLEHALRNAGFYTRATWSGHEALALVKSREFDALLVDDYLPDMHSGDFFGRIRRLPIQASIVVMQASKPTMRIVKKYASLGIASVVWKHNLDDVCKAVSSTLGGSRTEAVARKGGESCAD